MKPCERCACNPSEPACPHNEAAGQCDTCSAWLCEECLGDPNCSSPDCSHRTKEAK
jgi:hypothetical protein